MRMLYSHSIDEAIKKYPAIKSTVNKAKKNGINILSHSCTITKRGNVYQHRFVVKWQSGEVESMPNERLKGMMFTFGNKNYNS